MKKKIILIGAGVLASGAAVTSGVVLGVQAYNNKLQPITDPMLNEEAKKVRADYDDKTNTEASKIDVEKIRFSGVDFSIYGIMIRSVVVSSDDNTVLEIIFRLTDIRRNTMSDDTRINISGFKGVHAPQPPIVPVPPTPPRPPVDPVPPVAPGQPRTKAQLNAEIEKINTVVYLGDRANTRVSQVQISNFQFPMLSNEFEAFIINVVPETTDSTIAVITFGIREIGRSVVSDPKVIRLGGFRKSATTLEELNRILGQINRVTSRVNISNTRIEDFDPTNLIFDNLPTNIRVNIISVLPKGNDSTTALITFTINEIGNNVISSQKVLELSGFMKRALTVDELNRELAKVTVTFMGDRATTVLDDPEMIPVVFENVPPGISVITVSKAIKPNEPTTLLVSIRVKEVDGQLESQTRTVELTGFKAKSTMRTREELDEIIKNLKAKYDDPNQKFTLVSEIDSELLVFDFPDSNLEAIIYRIKRDKRNSTNAIITFKIREKGQIILSGDRTIVVSGFRRIGRVSRRLNRHTKAIQIDYPDKSNIILRTNEDLKKLSKRNITIQNTPDGFVTRVKSWRVDKNHKLHVVLYVIDTKTNHQSRDFILHISGFKTR